MITYVRAVCFLEFHVMGFSLNFILLRYTLAHFWIKCMHLYSSITDIILESNKSTLLIYIRHLPTIFTRAFRTAVLSLSNLRKRDCLVKMHNNS